MSLTMIFQGFSSDASHPDIGILDHRDCDGAVGCFLTGTYLSTPVSHYPTHAE